MADITSLQIGDSSASPYATADGPDISAGLSGPSADMGYTGGYYGFGSKIYNWITGGNTAREKQTEAANQRAMAIWNADQAQVQRDWEERMSNTAITRAVADAERNGINKYYLLSSGLTASTPSGATSSANYEPLNASGSRGSSVAGGLFKIIGAIINAYLGYKFGPAVAARKAFGSELGKQAARAAADAAKYRSASSAIYGAPLRLRK